MNPLDLINSYYPEENELKNILLIHSRKVAEKALDIAEAHPEYHLDDAFLYEASMLHDIGIFLTDAPRIYCFGTEPYIRHGLLGAELVRKEGYPRHALVCERHTGAGISLADINQRNLPLPQQDMLPVSFSKTRLEHEKTVEEARRSLLKFGDDGLVRFDKWCKDFL